MIDISFNQKTGECFFVKKLILLGPDSTAIVKQLLSSTPLLRPLLLLLKTYMRQRCLCDPYSGGIGAYALTLMVVSLLQVPFGFSLSISTSSNNTKIAMKQSQLLSQIQTNLLIPHLLTLLVTTYQIYLKQEIWEHFVWTSSITMALNLIIFIMV